MQRRDNLTYFILIGVIAVVLTLLMVCIDARAQIAFVSERDGNHEIYVMDADGGNQQNLTNNPHGNVSPAWLIPAFAVAPAGKKITTWGWLKQVDR